ncbi:MetQ/NlpA family ABC transporter substrate-binding protein [Benzoatithermus flavus]|uniref:MetQ/NlpA family ABC transporter substrate-binding protein n=1 Tax=Benzoatithermus flavus TaxID=3108223 RepID=A0ABU8XTD6_9PROT
MLRLVSAALMAALLAVPAFAAQTVKIGVSAGTHEQVMEVVRDIAKEKGLDLEIITFSDYILPNQALASGDLDANSFQHEPYLDQQIQDRGYDLVAVAKNFIEPMGVYSRKYRNLEDLPAGAQVAIPNDPSNGGRALLLLQQKGVVKVDPSRGLTPGILDITENPKKLAFVEIDAAQLPRALQDVDAAAINTNYALEAGLNPLKDAIAIESPESPYANLIVVRRGDENKPWVKTLIESYQNDKVRRFIEDTFEGAVVPAF